MESEGEGGRDHRLGCGAVAVVQKVAHDAAADVAMLGEGVEENGLDAVEVPVDEGEGALVFEVVHGADAAHDESSARLASGIDGKAVVAYHLHTRFIGVKAGNLLEALLGAVEAPLAVVDADGDDNAVENRQGARHDVGVA